MIDKELLEILACPETKEPVQLAEAELITELNSRIERGELKNRAGKTPADLADLQDEAALAAWLRSC